MPRRQPPYKGPGKYDPQYGSPWPVIIFLIAVVAVAWIGHRYEETHRDPFAQKQTTVDRCAKNSGHLACRGVQHRKN